MMVLPSVRDRGVMRLIVPARVKTIVSDPRSWFARSTAARNEPAPLSRRLVTNRVLGTVRSSSASTASRVECWRALDKVAPRSRRSGMEANLMVYLLSPGTWRVAAVCGEAVCGTREVVAAGAQTGRPGVAGPVRASLGGRASPAALLD